MPYAYVERTTARGRRTQVRRFVARLAEPEPAGEKLRPMPDRYDRFANAYQRELVALYDRWALSTENAVVRALEDRADASAIQRIIGARLADLEVEMKLLGRRRIAEAGGLGLGRILGKRASSPAVLQAIAAAQERNDRFIVESLMPSLRERFWRDLPAALDRQGIRAVLTVPRAQVASYSGGAVAAIFEAQAAAGMEENRQRRLQGEPPIPVRWVLDPMADHCEDDVTRGTFGCPGLAGEYPGGWDTLPTVPSGNVSCLGNCRCRLEVNLGNGWERL